MKLDLFFNLFDQMVFNFTVTQYIIRCNTCLAAIKKFAEYDSSGGKGNVGCVINNTGAFKISGCFTQTLTPDILASGKEDEIKLHGKQICIFFTSAHDNSNIFFIKAAADKFPDKST